MIAIDGSFGEGGGQVVRTALTLSALTGQPVRLHSIRAKRSNPGLAPQHLTGVLALAQICNAGVHGATLKSTSLEFHPQSRPLAGSYLFDVTKAAPGGSAGSVTLILQTLLLPLALADGPSTLTLQGGTHAPWSPPFHYLAHVFLPTVARMGLHASIRLDAWGFYPAGGGQISAEISPIDSLSPLSLIERGALKRVWGEGVAANLPAHIPQRIVSRARNVLAEAGLRFGDPRKGAEITPLRERGAGPGAGLFLIAEYEHALAGFSSIGEKGKPSEQVAEEASLDLIAHYRDGAPLDMHLADQLLLPMAFARGRSELRTCRVTQHTLTNAHIIQQFLPVKLEIEGEEGEPGRVVVSPA